MLVIFLVRVEFHIHKWIVFVHAYEQRYLFEDFEVGAKHDFEQNGSIYIVGFISMNIFTILKLFNFFFTNR